MRVVLVARPEELVGEGPVLGAQGRGSGGKGRG